ncbi:MAG: YgiQ family radical SAM protein [Candidatus Aminicenantes bacterium]|nr:YgiQ family radical SAM protein [Candidatus Aminicenantes bacterium]
MISEKGSGFDVILISGEPYADHPLSGVGVIARVLDAEGYKVGVIGRPDRRRDADFARLGRPRLFFGLTSGAIDSMLQNYTPLKRLRSRDPHAPHASGVPDRAVLVYANIVRRLFPGAVTVLGGVEASLRRFAHYDYWEDRVRRSLLLDSRADILVYGPGELQAVEIARRLERGEDLDGIAGTCVVRPDLPPGFREIPSYEDVSASKEKFGEAQKLFSNRASLAQKHAGRWVLQHPAPDYTTEDLDRIYGLPYTRRIPAEHPGLEMGRFSVVTHRGCVGGCSFCALALHQGDRIVSRSEESILEEVRRLARHPEFKGYVDDLGGPTANMYGMDCPRRATCRRDDCLACPKLDRSHGRLIRLMRRVREVAGVKKAFVRSGIRYDLALESPEYIEELARHHVSGLLKIAPEHVSDKVLRLMNKGGGKQALAEFQALFKKASGKKKQHLKYYFMVAHPGTGDREARELAAEVRRLEAGGERPVEGVQIFTPTPMTLSTCMYWTGRDPETGEEVPVPRTFEGKKKQRELTG